MHTHIPGPVPKRDLSKGIFYPWSNMFKYIVLMDSNVIRENSYLNEINEWVYF